jgi:hypothetical protein
MRKMSSIARGHFSLKSDLDEEEKEVIFLKYPDESEFGYNEKNKNKRRHLLFLLTGIVVFLVISQPNVLNTWLAIIPVITGSIPILLRLFDQLLGIGVKPE